MDTKTQTPKHLQILAKKTTVTALKVVGKIYYLFLRLLFVTSGKIVLRGASTILCPVCGKTADHPPTLEVRSNDPKLYDKRAWASALYDLKGISKLKSIHAYISGEKSNASKFARLNYYQCKGCDSFFKSGAQFWRLNFEIKSDYYSTSYRAGRTYGRPILSNSPRIANWTKYVSTFFAEISGVKILDMGCAEGYQVLAFQKLGFEAYGLEPNPAMCNYATQILGVNVGRIKQSFYETDCYGSESFHAISSFHTIEHCPSPREILNSSFLHLKNGGLLFLSTPSAAATFTEFEKTGKNLNFVDSHDFIMSNVAIEALALEVGFLKIKENNFDVLSEEFGIDNLGEKEGGMNFVFLKP